MSVQNLSRVWHGFPGAGSDLLALLALADWSDDEGRCFPSMSAIARKTRLSRSQAQRVVHGLIKDGFVRVTGNETGGSPGSTRQYRINLTTLTGRIDATGSAHATGRTDAQDGSHGCAETGSAHATQTISEPSTNRQSIREAKKPHRSKSVDSVPEGFDEFWLAYDKKVGRANSIKVWKSIKPDSALVQLIVSAAKSYSSAREQKYRKDPERWLKGSMWQDEAPSSGTSSKPEWMDGAI